MTPLSTRERVLRALEKASVRGLSGEALARELGVSRVAVGKHVAALRDQGYVIDAAAGSGYRLVQAPDIALPYEISRRVHNPLWGPFTGGLVTGSTNADAKALAKDGAVEGAVVSVARQLEGRGRLGRSWASPEGGAYVSVVLRPGIAPAEMGPLALVVGLGISRGLERLGVASQLKWPNDLLRQGRKLAGILLEMSAEGDRVDWVVAGFGINVRRPQGAAPEAAYLSDVVDVSVADAAAAALDGVAVTYREWLGNGFSTLLPQYLQRFALMGEQVTVRDAMGTVRARGVVQGVDEDGRLLVLAEDGLVPVASGEVTLRDPA